ncbi:MAG: anaerobic ribonucleoside-triphosphate reductase activating protein [Bacilli bacterium]|nr:anaerobic ribonucleoside-triphosphate reductase activating protein [Bacilli bacterium]
MDFVGVEKLSLVDFDHHMSAVLFSPGCNFACPFCHNSALVIAPEFNHPIPFNEILSFLKKRVGLLDAVVVTGGEPTLMPDLKSKIAQIKELGYKVKLDSNGSHPEKIKELVEEGLIDYIAMDVKSSFETYPEITNSRVNIDKIKESIEYIKSCGIDYEFRTTLVAEYHSEEDIRQMAKEIGNAKRMRLQLFVDGENCIERGLHEVDLATARKYEAILKETIPDVALRGYII